MRVSTTEISNFLLIIIALHLSPDYSRVVVTGIWLPATEGATFRCASSVRDRVKSVRNWGESCSRLSESAAAGVADHGTGCGLLPRCQATKNTRRQNSKSGSKPRGDWLSAKSAAKASATRGFGSCSDESLSFFISNHRLALEPRLFPHSCHENTWGAVKSASLSIAGSRVLVTTMRE